MIIVRDLMVHIVPMADFNCQVLQWDGATVHIKYPRNLIGQSNIIKRKIREGVVQISEPASTREATKLMVKIPNSNYAKADLEQLGANAIQINT